VLFWEIKERKYYLFGAIINALIIAVTMFLGISEGLRDIIIAANILMLLFNLLPKYWVAILLTAISSIAIMYFQNMGIFFGTMYIWIIVKNNKMYDIEKTGKIFWERMVK